MLEPRLVVFHGDGSQQMFLCAEKEVVFEIPTTSTKLIDGIIHLMAMYYVLDVQYPAFCKPMLFFMQDILMLKRNGEKRPTRYSTFVQNTGL